MASFKQIPDGRWRVFVSAESPEGRRRINRTVDTKEEAEALVPVLQAELGARQQEQRPGWVYFLKNRDGYIKIGFTTNLQSRLASLNGAAQHTGGRFDVLAIVAGTLEDERRIHERFFYCRNGHHEVFSPDKHLRGFIERMLKT